MEKLSRSTRKRKKNLESRATTRWMKKMKIMIHLYRQALTRLVPQAAQRPSSWAHTDSHRPTKVPRSKIVNLANNKLNKSPFSNHLESFAHHLHRSQTIEEPPSSAAAPPVNSNDSTRLPSFKPQIAKRWPRSTGAERHHWWAITERAYHSIKNEKLTTRKEFWAMRLLRIPPIIVAKELHPTIITIRMQQIIPFSARLTKV